MALAKVVKALGANAGYHRIIIMSIDPRDKVNYCLYSYANKTAADAGIPPMAVHHAQMAFKVSPAAGKNVIKLCYEAINKNPADTFSDIDLTGATKV